MMSADILGPEIVTSGSPSRGDHLGRSGHGSGVGARSGDPAGVARDRRSLVNRGAPRTREKGARK